MDHLSSCYFCGVALDEPLDDYPVVPDTLRTGDDPATVTLCPGCARKLETVLEKVVAAADADEGEPDPAGPDAGTIAPERAEPAAEDVDDAAEEGEASPEADVEPGSQAGDGDADGPGEAVAGDEGRDDDLEESMVADVPDELQSGGGSVDTVEDEPDDADGAAPAPAADPDAGEAGSEDGTTAEGGTDAADEQGATAGSDGTEDAAGSDEAPAEAVDESDDGDADAARTTVSALEYNKVMRLLQNREFPVDRREIETVAANAYGLAERECAGVIDLAIDRGLVDEENGQLVRPD